MVAPPPQPVAQAATGSPQPVVLVVDDDPAVVEELADLVASAGFPVRKTSDPGAVLRMVAEYQDIAIILTDLCMPRLDGRALATRLIQQGVPQPLQLIFMSGRATVEDTLSVMRLDAIDFLLKPISRKDLMRALSRAAEKISQRRRELVRNVDIMRSVEAVASHAIKLANEFSRDSAASWRPPSTRPVFVPKGNDRLRALEGPPADVAPAPETTENVEPPRQDEQYTRQRTEYLRNRVAALIQARRARGAYFDNELFSDPCWDMLLDLMNERLNGKEVAISSLCIAAGVPQTTGLRRIDDLVRAGLLVRREDPKDRRRVFVQLSDTAFEKLNRYLDEMNTLG